MLLIIIKYIFPDSLHAASAFVSKRMGGNETRANIQTSSVWSVVGVWHRTHFTLRMEYGEY